MLHVSFEKASDETMIDEQDVADLFYAIPDEALEAAASTMPVMTVGPCSTTGHNCPGC
jgi:hypothetical protein